MLGRASSPKSFALHTYTHLLIFLAHFVRLINGTEAVFSEALDVHDILEQTVDPNSEKGFHGDITEGGVDFSADVVYDHPHSFLVQPVLERLNDPKSDMVGLLQSIVPWDAYLRDLLPAGVTGIYVVLKNTCGQEYTYALDGSKVCFPLFVLPLAASLGFPQL